MSDARTDALTPAQRGALQARLEASAVELRALVARHARLANHNEETDDEAVADLETALDVAELERATQRLAALERALERLQGADFGRCEACGGPIPAFRLEADPAVTRCVPCQANFERGHPRSHGPAARL